MHLVKGNYGHHAGGARGQDLGGGAVAGGGAGGMLGSATTHGGAHHAGSAVGSRSATGLRPPAGVPDADDVDDILQQVRKDVKAIQHQAAGGRDLELDGRWAVEGTASPAFVVISGGVLHLPDGDGAEEQQINFVAPGKFFVNSQGQRLEGELTMNEIHWANGEVWLRVQDSSAAAPMSGGSATRRPAPAVKQLSRSFSEATWDRPRTRETTQDVEVPRAMPKATVRGRYVFSGGVEPQLRAGLPGQHGRGAAGSANDFGDALATQFSPRLGGGNFSS